MARVTVFVDDAVLGELPRVCARSGLPSDQVAILRESVGGPGWGSLLLLLLGPIGWIVYFLSSGGSETLTVRVPVAAPVVERWDRRRRDRWLGVALVVTGVGTLAITQAAAAWLVVLAGAAVVFVASWWLWSDGIGVELDASRRWVTLTGVHDEFRAAVEAAGRSARSSGR